jgi:hypothetical protein
MRLVSAFLFVALTGSAVLAEDAKPADPQPEVTTATKKKVPYRVVKILPETGQVLLFDRNHATHVVAEAGQVLDGYTVDEIDEDEVTLLADSGASVILTAPPPPPKKRAAKAQPVDPYADSAARDGAPATTMDGAAEPGAATAAGATAGDTAGATGTSKARGAAPVDPYADPEAPAAPGEGGVRVASAADPSTATVSPSASPSASVIVSPSPSRSVSVSPSPSRSMSASPSPSTSAVSPSPSTSAVSPSPSASGRSPSPGAPIVDSGAPELSDPYGDPGIAAFADAVGAAPGPAETTSSAETTTNPARKTTKAGKGNAKPAASPDAASALASAATGSPAGTTATGAPAATGSPAGTTATGAPAVTTSPAGTTSGATATAAPAGSIVVARAELDAALGDFTKTAGTFRAAFTADGLRFDAVAEGSLLAKVGLRKGDIVTYVDGKPLRSLDDAASLYARAGTMKSTTLQVARDGKNVTLRVAIR